MFDFFKQLSANRRAQKELVDIFARRGVNFMTTHPEFHKCLLQMAIEAGAAYTAVKKGTSAKSEAPVLLWAAMTAAIEQHMEQKPFGLGSEETLVSEFGALAAVRVFDLLMERVEAAHGYVSQEQVVRTASQINVIGSRHGWWTAAAGLLQAHDDVAAAFASEDEDEDG